MTEQFTDLTWRKITESRDGIATYQAIARYEGHRMVHDFFATDELASDAKAMMECVLWACRDFVRSHPPT